MNQFLKLNYCGKIYTALAIIKFGLFLKIINNINNYETTSCIHYSTPSPCERSKEISCIINTSMSYFSYS